jgi:hypothetical protein
MTPSNYSRLAAVIFTIVAVLQLIRAISGWELTIATTAIPLWASWVAAVVAGTLAWVGYGAARE